MSISPQRRLEIMDSLRRGTVPRSSLDAFAVGLERFEAALGGGAPEKSAGWERFQGGPG